MRFMQIVLGFALAGTLSACASGDLPTRNAPFETTPDSEVVAPDGYELTQAKRAAHSRDAVGQAPVPAVASADQAIAAPVSIAKVMVRVPRSLTVSEANRYLPRGDIVWREDPIGDRHAQVQKIVQDALVRGVAALQGPARVNLDVQVVRFHALTEKARYTTGGVHAITFDMVLTDPETGRPLIPARRVRADLEAFGGQQAINAVARGQTQKVRITNHLANVIRQELTRPDGHQNAKLGLIQVLNTL